jgi:hypothetical protein
MTSDYETEKLAARARRTELRLARSAAEIDLDALDAQLRAELAQQVKDGLITQAEADRIGDRLRLTNYTPEGK